MDGTVLALFLATTFVGGVVSGVAGFALGLVVSGVWLHILTPTQTATLIVLNALLTQTYAIWRLRHSLSWRAAAPYVIGGVAGTPIGTALLTYVDPSAVRTGVGVLIVAYGILGLARPTFRPMQQTGRAAGVTVGVFNGVLGGLTGLVGIVIAIWCQWRGWPKDIQRSVFQPVMLAAAVVGAASLGVAGAITVETMKLYLLGVPLLIAGLWTGFRLYGKLDDDAFRRIILVLLLASGLALIVPLSSLGLR